MKRITTLLATLAVTLYASGAVAQTAKEEDHKAHHPDAAASTAAPAVAPKPAAPSQMGPAGGMHGRMNAHCKEMEKIMSIKDAKKRQKAMDKHMKDMKGMSEGDCPMMKGGMGSGMGMGAGASAPMDMNGGMTK